MVTRRDRRIAVKAFVEISFAIAVEIMKPDDPIATRDINYIVYNFHAERLKQPRCISFPLNVLQRVIDSGDDPDIAAPGRNRCAAIREKIKSAESQPRSP